jgi:hypothetical protein
VGNRSGIDESLDRTGHVEGLAKGLKRPVL